MTTAYCHKCMTLQPAALYFGTMTVVCQKCGKSESIVEPDRELFALLEHLPRTHEQDDCVMIDVTGKCKAACQYCYKRTGGHRTLEEIIEDADEANQHRILLSGGEPTEWPHLKEAVRAISRHKETILLTNGSNLTSELLDALVKYGLSIRDGWPQVAVSLQLPGRRKLWNEAYRNLRDIKVEMIAFTVSDADDVEEALGIARVLRDQCRLFCFRTSWTPNKSQPYMSEVISAIDGDLLAVPSPYGYRSAAVDKDGMQIRIISWPSIYQYDSARYADRGVWYRGNNVVTTLIRDAVTVR